MLLHMISGKASISPATLQKHLQPQQGKKILVFPPALPLGPSTDKHFLAFITAPSAEAGYSYPQVSSAWHNALDFLSSIAMGASSRPLRST